MRKLLQSLAGNHVIWLFCQITILVICVSWITHTYQTNILPDKEAVDSYNQATCFLISKKLSAGGEVFERYRADFFVSYQVGSGVYKRWVSGNGLDQGFSHSSAEKKDLLVKYEVGKTYPCWYNPEAPESVYLVPRQDWSAVLPLFVPAAVAVVALYYLVKTLFRLVDGNVIRSRKKRKH